MYRRTHIGTTPSDDIGITFYLRDYNQKQDWIILAILSEAKQVHHWTMINVDMYVLDVTSIPEDDWAD